MYTCISFPKCIKPHVKFEWKLHSLASMHLRIDIRILETGNKDCLSKMISSVSFFFCVMLIENPSFVVWSDFPWFLKVFWSMNWYFSFQATGSITSIKGFLSNSQFEWVWLDSIFLILKTVQKESKAFCS